MDNGETVRLTPAEYRIAMIKNNDDTILARGDALCFRGYGNWDYEDSVQVYSKKPLSAPYECNVVKNFENIEYSEEHGIPVCTERQAFIDLLNNPKNELQTLLEALGDYYYTHNKSFDSLNLPKKYQLSLNRYKDDAIHYWDY